MAIRFGATPAAPLRTDVARLTPLPSARQPQVMFMGVLDGGHQAVFALGAGVKHSGPGICRLSRTHCSVILLRAGQTEQLVLAGPNSTPQPVILRVARITSTVTHSDRVALAAFDRHSGIGMCELDLADPVAYDPTTGTLSSVAVAACKDHPRAVAFQPAVFGS